MLEDRSQVARLRKVIELPDTPPHASDRRSDPDSCSRNGISSLLLPRRLAAASKPGAMTGRATAMRSSEYVCTSASSVKLRLRPLGLGSIHAIVPPNPDGYRPQSTSGRPVIIEKPCFPRNAIERGA